MASSRSRYAPEDAAPSYGHRFHAGNVGDVWKHCALIEVLRHATAPIHYVETHAGEGSYALGATGEWTEGIGRLWAATDLGDGVVARYVALCRRLGGGARPQRYPGSPLLAAHVLAPTARLTLCERDPAAFARLETELGADARVRVILGDGLTTLAALDAATVVLVDPPWSSKADWIALPDAIAAAAARLPDACIVLWYPVKSLTRPNAMHARLAAAGVSATIAELITTSLKHQRNRLNGSGVLFVRPPTGTLGALAAAAPTIGRICATRTSAWSFRMHAW